VAESETLETIAAAYGVSVPALRALNQLPDDAEVRVGQELLLPSPEL
jgi:LysM repeat protein